MNAIQLEFNIDDMPEEDFRLKNLEKHINDTIDMLKRTDRRLFAEMSTMKKTISELTIQNQNLKHQINGLTNAKKEWIYAQGDNLFDIPKI